MKIRVGLLSVFAFGTLFGCGGGGTGSNVAQTPLVYYRGTVNVLGGSNITTGSSPIAANFYAPGHFSGYFWNSSIQGTISRSGIVGVLDESGTKAYGSVVASNSATDFSFTLSQNSTTIATATLSQQASPTLGTGQQVPTTGTYNGELIIFDQGRVVDFGGVTSTVDAKGKWVGTASSVGPWIGGGTFGGYFVPLGALTSPSLKTYYGTATQKSAAPYSYDGTNLVIRVDSLTLKPGTCWLTLTRQ